MNKIEKIFKLKESNTTIKTEILAGLTTFFTMSYLFVLSPKLLELAGMEFEASVTVTGIVVFLGSLLMAFIANKPYAAAPFLGETAFISYTIVNSLGFSIKTAFAAITVCGVILLIMTLFGVREYIIEKIPENIKISFCCGLGLFFISLSLQSMGIIKYNLNSLSPVEIGNFTQINVILGLFCFILLITLVKKGINAAVIISIAVTTILGVIFKDVNLPQSIISLPYSINSSLLQTDFNGLINKNFLPIMFVIFILVNIDTSGALIGLSYKEGVQTKQNNKKAMIADSLAVIGAPFAGTTTPGAYMDSITGISAGGKTGLTALTIGVLFLSGIFFTPIIVVIPPYAYAPALLYVGILMTCVISKINFNDISETAQAFLPLSIMIFSYNIGAGIMAAFFIYPIIQLLCSKKNKISIISWIMFAASIFFFIFYPY